jgi:hypothetical protein
MVVFTSRCPATSWAMCGGMPSITASVMNNLLKSWGWKFSGWPLGLEVSLAAAEARLAQVDGLIARRRDAVSLGMPSFSDLAGRTAAPAKGPQ